MIDRVKKAPILKVKWGVPHGMQNSYNFEVFKMPGYNLKTFPYLLMRDDYSIKVFNVNSKRLTTIKSAYYGSQGGYKTMDIIFAPTDGSASEFEAVYLVTGEESNPNNATTTINRIVFNDTFINTLRKMI